MGCCLSFDENKSKIEVINKIPKGKEHNYLKLKGRIVFIIDSTYTILKIEFGFNDWWMNSIYLWRKGKKARSHFLALKKVHISPQTFFLAKVLIVTLTIRFFSEFQQKKNIKGNAFNKTIKRFR